MNATTQASPVVHSVRMVDPSVGHIDFTWTDTVSSMDPMLDGVFITFRPMLTEKPYYCITICIGNDRYEFHLISNRGLTFKREDARVLWAAITMDGWQVKEQF
jgi:hypothetical protein